MRTQRYPVGAPLRNAAAQFWAEPFAPAPARPASTVLLLREIDSHLEVFTQRRAATMAFAASMVVFPGGGAEPGETPEQTAVREVQEECGLTLTGSDLLPWARWVTPECAPRRYDTTFFLAKVPAGQMPRNLGTEASEVLWATPHDLLADETVLMPPTLVTLRELRTASLRALYMTPRDLSPVLPYLVSATELEVRLPN